MTSSWAYTRSNAEWFPMANYPLWENYNPEKGSVTGKMMGGDMVFALNPDTGAALWTHQGKRIGNLTMSIGDGKVFFAESGVTEELSKPGVGRTPGPHRQGPLRRDRRA